MYTACQQMNDVLRVKAPTTLYNYELWFIRVSIFGGEDLIKQAK